MKARTHRRLMWCLVVGLIALPAEALLLPVARTPDAAEAAMEWAASRSPEALAAAAADIDAYPLVYRRAIMAQLSPDDRADAWRDHIGRYLQRNRKLNRTQVALLTEAMDLMRGELFDPPIAPSVRDDLMRLFNEATLHLGAEATKELFVNLGPVMSRRQNPLSLRQQAADRLRAWRAPSARAPDCNCNIEIDTCTVWPEPAWLECSERYTCNFDLNWPMCGPLWSWACTGWCRVVIWPGVEIMD